jgi:hypothetical protein
MLLHTDVFELLVTRPEHERLAVRGGHWNGDGAKILRLRISTPSTPSRIDKIVEIALGIGISIGRAGYL